LELLKQLKRHGILPNEGTRLIEKHTYKILKAIEMEEAELEEAGNEGEDEGCCAQQTVIRRMDGSNCLIDDLPKWRADTDRYRRSHRPGVI
jgi:hypothetical protein